MKHYIEQFLIVKDASTTKKKQSNRATEEKGDPILIYYQTPFKTNSPLFSN